MYDLSNGSVSSDLKWPLTQGLKYLKMSTTHWEGRWRGRRPRARHGGAKRRSAEGGGVWGGAPCPQKILKFNSANLFIISTISRQIALPSVVFHSFTAYIRSYLLSEKSPLHFVTSHNTVQQSQLHTWQSQLHTLSKNTQFQALCSFAWVGCPERIGLLKVTCRCFFVSFPHVMSHEVQNNFAR